MRHASPNDRTICRPTTRPRDETFTRHEGMDPTDDIEDTSTNAVLTEHTPPVSRARVGSTRASSRLGTSHGSRPASTLTCHAHHTRTPRANHKQCMQASINNGLCAHSRSVRSARRPRHAPPVRSDDNYASNAPHASTAGDPANDAAGGTQASHTMQNLDGAGGFAR